MNIDEAIKRQREWLKIESEMNKKHLCTSCEEIVEEGWHFCPYCGRPIKWWLIEERENDSHGEG